LRWLRIDRRPAAASIGNALRRRRSDQPDYALPRLRRSGQGARPVRGGEHAGRAAATAQDHGSIATIPKASRSRARAALSAQGDRPRRWFLREYGSPAPWEIGAGQARLSATIAMRHGDASPHKWGCGRKRPESAEDWPEKAGAGRRFGAYPMARRRRLRVGVTAVAPQGVRRRLRRKPAARPCRPFSAQILAG
jgi:hypothetical protein